MEKLIKASRELKTIMTVFMPFEYHVSGFIQMLILFTFIYAGYALDGRYGISAVIWYGLTWLSINKIAKSPERLTNKKIWRVHAACEGAVLAVLVYLVFII